MCNPFAGKRVWLVAVLILSLFACRHADQPVLSRRMGLIAALKELRGRIVSEDKARIDSIFSFPVPDSVFKTYFDDSLFQVQDKRNGNAITQAMFNTYFGKISGTLQLDEFQRLFSCFRLDDLEKKDTIQIDTAFDGETCNRVYTIEVQGDSNVYISYGSGSFNSEAPKAEPKAATGAVKDTAAAAKDTAGLAKDSGVLAKDTLATNDEVEGEDSSACEYSIFWVFVFDGNDLKLQYMGEAE